MLNRFSSHRAELRLRGQRDVHVWALRLDLPSANFSHLLTPDECERAGRFLFERDSRRFVVTRASLRILLGLYQDTESLNIRFRYGSHGKPELVGGSSIPAIHFNVSHSNELALIALALQPIGTDVEYTGKPVEFDQIAQRYFSNREYSALRELTPNLRHAAFFNCWTRKEAFLKAIGTGLSTPLDAFDVTLEPVTEPRILRLPAAATENWSLYHLEPMPDYVAAVAVQGRNHIVTSYLQDPSEFLD
jgi:4'-phosphopantetheinyl transferase